MSYESFVGMRYLMAKKRSSVVSIITLISITGVALGVTALIVVLSVMGGFKKDLKQKILGTKAHIMVQAPEEKPLTDALEVADLASQVGGVVGASPFLESEVMISSPAGLSGVVLRGIVPERIGQVSDFPKYIAAGEGKLEYLDDPGALMDGLAAERDKELDELIAKIKREREDLEETKKDLDGDEGDKKAAPAKKPAPADSILDGGKKGIDIPVLEEDILGIPATDFKGIAKPPKGKGRGAELIVSDKEPEPLGQDELDGLPDSAGIPTSAPELVGADPLDEALDIPDLPDDDEEGMPPIVDDMPPITGDEPSGEPKISGLIIGPELARSLQVRLGDEVNVVTPNGDLGPMGRLPRSRPFRVVGIFYSGMYEYDANFAYTKLDDAMKFVRSEGATGVELKTVDVEQSLEIADRVRAKLAGQGEYEVLDWTELNRSLFFALKLEKIAMFVVLAFIILVASFSIVAMLIMIVIEKAREIAVLKSLGATNFGVMKTFIFQGTVIGAVGSIIGLILGLIICYLLETVGFPLNSEVYYISKLPVDLNWSEVVSVVVCALGISVLATIYPSIQAARLKPVDGLRDE